MDIHANDELIHTDDEFKGMNEAFIQMINLARSQSGTYLADKLESFYARWKDAIDKSYNIEAEAILMELLSMVAKEAGEAPLVLKGLPRRALAEIIKQSPQYFRQAFAELGDTSIHGVDKCRILLLTSMVSFIAMLLNLVGNGPVEISAVTISASVLTGIEAVHAYQWVRQQYDRFEQLLNGLSANYFPRISSHALRGFLDLLRSFLSIEC